MQPNGPLVCQNGDVLFRLRTTSCLVFPEHLPPDYFKHVKIPLDFSPSFSARRSLDPAIMARMLTSEDTANIRNMLQDPDAGGDVLFWLYATVAYAVLRVTTEVLFPGKIGKFTTQRMPHRARTHRA